MATIPEPPLVVVMGVSGAGKTVVGSTLAEILSVPFIDGDDLHPQANIDKMSAGHALDDDDRRPWLQRIGQWLCDHREDGTVVACSALKVAYRDLLRQCCPNTAFIHLAGDPEVVTARVGARPGHFMPTSLVASQYQTLEPLTDAEHGVTLDLSASIEELAGMAVEWLASHPAPGTEQTSRSSHI